MMENNMNNPTTTPHSMDNSILRFKNVNFIVGKNTSKEKNILTDVSGTVKWGQVLAIMGPSGAGKTTLISALTLDAFYGTPTGIVTLNGVSMTDSIFKSHCYVVVQHDKHWPYLTCRETLLYAAQLYNVATNYIDQTNVVNEIISKMGLSTCSNTRNGRLSGGQARRLSIGIALLKKPTVLFLDEPTSGLDAAAAENIMKEIVRVAKDERLIIICTIHQPSTKVYNGFDQVMIMSKGRQAYMGDVHDAAEYFQNIGYPLPEQINPAEHFLDLVNADFSDEKEVVRILDVWEENRPDSGHSSHHNKKNNNNNLKIPAGNDNNDDDDDDEGQEGVSNIKKATFINEIMIVFRRSFTLIIRDPILYIGRAFVFLVANIIFSVVYYQARKYNQEQATNKMWIVIWHVAVASNMGVVAVYALNDEFKTIVRETKNGLVGPLSYVLAKTILVIPIIFVFAVFALGIPAFVIMDFPISSFAAAIINWSATMYVYECVAECLSVWFDDPIFGMLQFMNFWFGGFLFGGFLIALRDLNWPFKVFYYVMPMSYYVRLQMYTLLHDTTWNTCTDPITSAVCVSSSTNTDGRVILGEISRIFPVIENNDTFREDVSIIMSIAIFFKILYIIGVIMKARQVAKIIPN